MTGPFVVVHHTVGRIPSGRHESAEAQDEEEDAEEGEKNGIMVEGVGAWEIDGDGVGDD